MEIIDNACTSLKSVGKDGKWVCEWILEKPSRLGLGNIEIEHHELVCSGHSGIRQEILAYLACADTYYEIEIMLEECDANHNGLRALEFSSRERLKHPDARHVAVIVSENLSSTYGQLLEALPQVLPFIGIEIRVLKLSTEYVAATILPSVIVRSDNSERFAGHSIWAPNQQALDGHAVRYQRYGDGPHRGADHGVENPPGDRLSKQWGKHLPPDAQADKP